MRYIQFILVPVLVAFLASCTSPRYASTSEYDDVYYSSDDQTTPLATASTEEGLNEDYSSNYYRNPDAYREPVDSYNDVYQDDDFFFSRRVRRFNQTNQNSWRYFDPYFSNDLYFVMGTNSWNNWNNRGWYNWNSPRFGSYYGWNNNPYWNDPFFSGFNRFGSWGWNAPVYYNPWVNSYYGIDPFGFNPYNRGFTNGFNFGRYGGYYCPPVTSNGWNNFNRNVNNSRASNATVRSRTTTQTNSSRTNYNNGRPDMVRRPDAGKTPQTRTANPDGRDYLRPRSNAEIQRARTNTTLPSRTRVNTNTRNNTNLPASRNSNSNSRNNTINRSRTNSNRNNNNINRSRTNSRNNSNINRSRTNSNRNNNNINRSRTNSRSNNNINRTPSNRNNNVRPSSSPSRSNFNTSPSRSRSNFNSSPSRSNFNSSPSRSSVSPSRSTPSRSPSRSTTTSRSRRNN